MWFNFDVCGDLIRYFEPIFFDKVPRISETKIWESNKQKLLGVVIDRNLNFDEYVFDLRQKAGGKLSVLERLSNYMSFEERQILHLWNHNLDTAH